MTRLDGLGRGCFEIAHRVWTEHGVRPPLQDREPDQYASEKRKGAEAEGLCSRERSGPAAGDDGAGRTQLPQR